VAALIACFACWHGLSGVLLGISRFRVYASATVADAAVRACAMIPLVLSLAVPGALSAYVAGSVAANALALRAIGGIRVGSIRWLLGRDVAHVTGDWALLTLVGGLLQNLDLVLLRHYASAEDVGWYAAGGAVANLLFTLASPIYSPAYPRMVAAHERGRSTLPLLLATLLPLVGGGVLASIVAVWLATPINLLLFGTGFAGSAQYWPVLLAKTTALLMLLTFGQYAIAKRVRLAMPLTLIPCVLGLVSVAVAQPPPALMAALVGTTALLCAAVAVLVTAWRARAPKQQ
jgi:O-antigen/teichoic acid export membrane protein